MDIKEVIMERLKREMSDLDLSVGGLSELSGASSDFIRFLLGDYPCNNEYKNDCDDDCDECQYWDYIQFTDTLYTFVRMCKVLSSTPEYLIGISDTDIRIEGIPTRLYVHITKSRSYNDSKALRTCLTYHRLVYLPVMPTIGVELDGLCGIDMVSPYIVHDISYDLYTREACLIHRVHCQCESHYKEVISTFESARWTKGNDSK